MPIKVICNTFLLSFVMLFLLNRCAETPKKEKRILVFSKTGGWVHTSIPYGMAAIRKLGTQNGIRVDTTRNARYFTEDSLKNYNAVIFLNTTQDVLDYRQQADFERYIQAGGGFVGVHSAADTEYDWLWYGKLVGAYFESHPNYPDSSNQFGVLTVVDSTHPATQGLPHTWKRFDEWYSFKAMNPDVKVLLTIDEKTYTGGKNGNYHPMAWYHAYDGGRSFYTNLGHTNESYEEPLFLKHLLGGIQYAIGENALLDYSKATTVRVPEENRFAKIVLDENLDEPMELAIANDGRVVFIERHGNIKIYDPATQQTKVITKLEVFSQKEDGLLGVALDPDFDTNKWIYFLYSPAGDIPKQHLSRFVLDGDSLLMDSEKVLLEIPVIREESTHSAGSLAFGPEGNLYISIGDNTVPFASDGYAPIDERAGRAPWDAQKSSGNPNDLRGKILRIQPQPDGTYTIPDGNLFPKNDTLTRPEIYVMGNRNPFRISIDQRTGFLYWGEVGPDAGEDSTGRGPKGHDEINQARKAGNFGWPYFVGDNKAYHDYDFVTKKSGTLFNPDAPVNNSPNNTGIQKLPPAQKAFIWYPYSDSREFPVVGKGGRNAMAGPVFYYDDFTNARKRFPEYYDGKLIIYDWMRNWIMAVTMDSAGNLQKIEPFLPSLTFNKPVDMQFGKDGALYMLEYGTYWGSQNADARLVKIEYSEGNRPPIAKVTADKTVGKAPLTVQFSAASSFDYDPEDKLTYEWQFTGQDKETSTEPAPAFTFSKPGNYQSAVTVIDSKGERSTAQVEIKVGNEPPVVALDIEGNQTFYWDGYTIPYQVQITDAEDGTLQNGIDSGNVLVTFDYLPQGKDMIAIAQGHQMPTGSAQFSNGKQLIENSDCKACHAIDRKSVGPSYQDVAKRYQHNKKAVDFLSAKIIKGGSGNWGDHAMSAHPQLTTDQAREMVQYILSLAADKAATHIPLSGLLATNKQTGEEGSYHITLSYTDKGGEGIGPLTTRREYMFRHPKIKAADYDAAKGVAKKNNPENNSRFIRFSENGAYFSFENIDLTGINYLTYHFSSAKVGGTLEVRLDSAQGKLISSKAVKATGGGSTYVDVKTDLIQTEGIHDLFFVFVEAPDAAEAMNIWNTFNIDWIYFGRDNKKAMAAN